MKNTLLFFLFIFSVQFSRAQNYQCLQSGVKHYFTNGEGYLRGIRIDSIRIMGSDTVYYPYRTERMRDYVISSGISPIIDTNGSSWLGKNVIEKPDGTFIFNNMWDTIFIKSRAQPGDSWMFFNDTTQLYYTATVLYVDTMSILGYLDSIKTINITAYKSGVVDSIDPMNNFQIILSKNNGFVQVFDLYTFPYREPDSNSYDFSSREVSSRFDDYYLDVLLGNLGTCDLGCMPFDNLADSTNSIFHLITVHDPTKTELYDFAPGDVYEYYNYFHSDDDLVLDSIISKNTSTYPETYSVHEHQMYMTPRYNSSGLMVGYDTSYSSGTVTWIYDTTHLLNLNYAMPEETYRGGVYYYIPADTSFCNNPATYKIDQGHSFVYNGYAYLPTYYTPGYTIGYGYSSLYAIDPPDVSYGQDEGHRYTYIYKNGSTCIGTYIPAIAAVNSLSIDKYLQIFPNPANNELTIKTTNTLPYTISIYNMIGQQVYKSHTTLQEQTINTSELPAGLYNVIVTDAGGNRYNNKVVITH